MKLLTPGQWQGIIDNCLAGTPQFLSMQLPIEEVAKAKRYLIRKKAKLPSNTKGALAHWEFSYLGGELVAKLQTKFPVIKELK